MILVFFCIGLSLEFLSSHCQMSAICDRVLYTILIRMQCIPENLQTVLCSLQWRHNECDGPSNNLRLYYLLNREGNPLMSGGYPSQSTSNAETVSIWWRHHVVFLVRHTAATSCTSAAGAKTGRMRDEIVRAVFTTFRLGENRLRVLVNISNILVSIIDVQSMVFANDRIHYGL